jgi:hypothetical protein
MEGSVVLGVVGGTSDEPRVGYLTEPQATSLALLRLAETVKPTEVFRIAARCARTVCHDGAECGLARQIVDLVPPVTRGLPPCRIRPAVSGGGRRGAAPAHAAPLVVTETIDQARRYAAWQRLEAPDGPDSLGSF